MHFRRHLEPPRLRRPLGTALALCLALGIGGGAAAQSPPGASGPPGSAGQAGPPGSAGPVVTPGGAPPGAKADLGTDPALQVMLNDARRTGSVAVIAELGLPFLPEGTLSAADAEAQRSAIERAQTRILERLGAAAKNVKRFDTVPFLAVTVDAAGLERLVQDPEVVSIQPDSVSAPAGVSRTLAAPTTSAPAGAGPVPPGADSPQSAPPGALSGPPGAGSRDAPPGAMTAPPGANPQPAPTGAPSAPSGTDAPPGSGGASGGPPQAAPPADRSGPPKR